jgi:hypothetical protein
MLQMKIGQNLIDMGKLHFDYQQNTYQMKIINFQQISDTQKLIKAELKEKLLIIT